MMESQTIFYKQLILIMITTLEILILRMRIIIIIIILFTTTGGGWLYKKENGEILSTQEALSTGSMFEFYKTRQGRKWKRCLQE